MLSHHEFLSAWLSSRSHGNSHEDLRDYHLQAYHAYAKAFGVDLNMPPCKSNSESKEEDAESYDQRILHEIFIDFAYKRIGCHSPFQSYLMGPQSISMIYRKYSSQLEEALTQYRAVQEAILLDFMRRIWGIEDSVKVSQETLNQCGYPEQDAPHEWDYI